MMWAVLAILVSVLCISSQQPPKLSISPFCGFGRCGNGGKRPGGRHPVIPPLSPQGPCTLPKCRAFVRLAAPPPALCSMNIMVAVLPIDAEGNPILAPPALASARAVPLPDKFAKVSPCGDLATLQSLVSSSLGQLGLSGGLPSSLTDALGQIQPNTFTNTLSQLSPIKKKSKVFGQRNEKPIN